MKSVAAVERSDNVATLRTTLSLRSSAAAKSFKQQRLESRGNPPLRRETVVP